MQISLRILLAQISKLYSFKPLEAKSEISGKLVMWIIQAQSNQIFFSLGNNGMHLNVVNTNNLVKDETSYDKDARIYLAKVS